MDRHYMPIIPYFISDKHIDNLSLLIRILFIKCIHLIYCLFWGPLLGSVLR